MKKILTALLALTLLFTFVACGDSNSNEDSVDIAFVYDIGELDDASYNEESWKSVKKFSEEHDVNAQSYKAEASELNAQLEQIQIAIDDGAKTIVTAGVQFEDAIESAQKTYPDTNFLLIDVEMENATENTHSITYKEDQAGYLAGYAAVMEGYRKLGFLGGMEVAPVIRYGTGYVQGAEDAIRELGLEEDDLEMEYWYSGSFVATDEIQEKMDEWYENGTEVVFSCGGTIHLNAIAAAEEFDGKVIGVDVDQSGESDVVITSATKNLASSIENALNDIYTNDGTWSTAFAGKNSNLGAAEDGIGLPTEDWKLKNWEIEDYEELFEKIAEGLLI